MVDIDRIIGSFNKREVNAFNHIYLLFYNEFNVFASKLYYGTNILSEDIVHDIFIKIWISSTKFESSDKLKIYIYISIKNGFKDYCSHNKCVDKYKNYVTQNDDKIDIFECETYSIVSESLKILPKNYANIIKLFLEGYKSSEIAEIVGRPKQNVYNMKNEALNIIKKKIKLY